MYPQKEKKWKKRECADIPSAKNKQLRMKPRNKSIKILATWMSDEFVQERKNIFKPSCSVPRCSIIKLTCNHFSIGYCRKLLLLRNRLDYELKCLIFEAKNILDERCNISVPFFWALHEYSDFVGCPVVSLSFIYAWMNC